MTELQKKLTDIGGFATLRKTKTIDRELTRKVQSDHISRKLQGMSTMTQELQKYDKLSKQSATPSIKLFRMQLKKINVFHRIIQKNQSKSFNKKINHKHFGDLDVTNVSNFCN